MQCLAELGVHLIKEPDFHQVLPEPKISSSPFLLTLGGFFRIFCSVLGESMHMIVLLNLTFLILEKINM
jgi:hypothetical protein